MPRFRLFRFAVHSDVAPFRSGSFRFWVHSGLFRFGSPFRVAFSVAPVRFQNQYVTIQVVWSTPKSFSWRFKSTSARSALHSTPGCKYFPG